MAEGRHRRRTRAARRAAAGAGAAPLPCRSTARTAAPAGTVQAHDAPPPAARLASQPLRQLAPAGARLAHLQGASTTESRSKLKISPCPSAKNSLYSSGDTRVWPGSLVGSPGRHWEGNTACSALRAAGRREGAGWGRREAGACASRVMRVEGVRARHAGAGADGLAKRTGLLCLRLLRGTQCLRPHRRRRHCGRRGSRLRRRVAGQAGPRRPKPGDGGCRAAKAWDGAAWQPAD